MLPTGLSSMGLHYSWVVPFYVAGSASTVGLVKSDVHDHSDLDRHSQFAASQLHIHIRPQLDTHTIDLFTHFRIEL